MRTGHRILFLTTLAATASLYFAGSAAADTTYTLTLSPSLRAPVGQKVSGLPTSAQTCSQVLAQLSALAAAGEAKVPCLAGSTGSGSGSGVKPMLTYQNPQLQCWANDVIGAWYYGREWFCYIDPSEEIDTIDTSDGSVIGTAVYTIVHAAGLDPQNTSWSGFTSFTLQSESGDPSNIVDSTNVCTGCSGINSAPTFASPTAAALGQELDGNTTYLSDLPAAGQIDGAIAVGWSDAITCNGCSNVSTLSYTFPEPVRCDQQANTGPAGCAIPAYVPQLILTGLSSGNTSTAWFDFIQTNNVDHWGEYPSGSLLTRLNNPTQATANRNAMCAGFTANPLQTNDSCDEFPMASTYQSGNMLGLSPSDCSQGIPEYVSAANEWEFIMYPGYSPSQRCGIGHVNSSDNSSTGGQYGNFILNNRLLDGDSFWLGFTN